MGRNYTKKKYKNLEIACVMNDVTFLHLSRIAGMGESTIHQKRKGLQPFSLLESARIVTFFNKEFGENFTIDYLFKEIYEDV